MNPLWALLFKDRIRTPFSVYKMSLAEVIVLGGIMFGIGYGITRGIYAIRDLAVGQAVVVEAPTVK